MFLDAKDKIVLFSKQNFTIWFALSFQAGFINIGGFLACHRFVTHTTGFATHFGDAITSHQPLSLSLGMLSVPLFFLLGCMISAFLVDKRLVENKKPNYAFVFLFIALLLVFITSAGFVGTFGIFGEAMDIQSDYFLLSLLSLASGLQNAVVTSASGAVVRTTHLTGVTTDLGIGLVRIFSQIKTKNSDLYEKEKKANVLRTGTILCFIAGSIAGGLVFRSFQYAGFILPGTISLTLSLFAYRVQNEKYANAP